jgi:hypothetical protein
LIHSELTNFHVAPGTPRIWSSSVFGIELASNPGV